MRKVTMLLTAMTVIAFAYVSTSALAGDLGVPVGKAPYEASNWIGKEVKNFQGESLGMVKDFIWDSRGRVSFAVVSHGDFLGFGGKDVTIPYSALTYDNDKQVVTCDISKDRFAAAPEFYGEEVTPHNRSSAAEVYKYYGQAPYWTEGSMEMK